MRRLAGSLLLLGLVAACTAPGAERRLGVHADVVVADDYDAKIEAPGFSAEGETEYDSARLALSVRSDSAEGARQQRVLMFLGVAQFHRLDAIEFGGEGRWFLLEDSWVLPFVGVGGRITAFESVDSTDLGTMLTLAPLVGLEFPLGDDLSLDLVLEYGLPLIPAESDGGTTVETSAEGLGLRFGLSWDFGPKAPREPQEPPVTATTQP